jgi:hypothetical protein
VEVHRVEPSTWSPLTVAEVSQLVVVVWAIAAAARTIKLANIARNVFTLVLGYLNPERKLAFSQLNSITPSGADLITKVILGEGDSVQSRRLRWTVCRSTHLRRQAP